MTVTAFVAPGNKDRHDGREALGAEHPVAMTSAVLAAWHARPA